MAPILATAKSKISIGSVTAKATMVLADYTGDAANFKVIDGVKNIGSFGDVRQLITSDQVNAARTQKAKGTANAGSMEISCDRVPADVGQIAALAAADGDGRYNIKVEIPAGVGKIDTFYFPAYVMQGRFNLGGPNNPQEVAFTFEIDDKPLYVAAP